MVVNNDDENRLKGVDLEVRKTEPEKVEKHKLITKSVRLTNVHIQQCKPQQQDGEL